MLVSFDALAQHFAQYTDIKGKIRREVQGGRLVQVARGLYETDARTDGKYLAGAIYGPSYLSFDYALSVHTLIPEAVYGTYTSATFQKGKTKRSAWKSKWRGDILIRSPHLKKRCATSCIRFRPCTR